MTALKNSYVKQGECSLDLNHPGKEPNKSSVSSAQITKIMKIMLLYSLILIKINKDVSLVF